MARQNRSLNTTETFRRDLAEWESIGRGQRVWEFPVYVEPPFEPFVLRPNVPTAVVDDGRHHTAASWAIERISQSFARRRPRRIAPEIPNDDFAWLGREQVPLVEMQALLPENLTVPRESLEHLLSVLKYCSRPLCFELIGLRDSIQFQMVVAEQDLPFVEPQLAALLPEIAFIKKAGHLSRLWQEAHSTESLVVDFALGREFLFPIATAREIKIDPLVGIAGVLGDIRLGELGVFQVIFEPTRCAWSESLNRIMEFASDAASQIKQKISCPLYAVVVRAGFRGTSARIRQLAQAIVGCLDVLSNPDGNTLIPLRHQGCNFNGVDYLHERRTFRSGMLLNSDELLAIARFPSSAVRHPKFERMVKKTKALPKIALGHELVLGENRHANESKIATLNADQRTRHMHVIGTSGTGKSCFLLNCIMQDIENGGGLAVLDPHGDLIDEILSRVPERRIDDVVLVDPSDEEYPIGFNILSAHSNAEKTLLASDLVSVFRRLSTSWGDQMNSVFANAILAFLESSEGGTLADLRRFLVESAFRNEILETVEDPEIMYYWKKQYPLLTGNKSQGPLLTRLDTFLRPKPIRYMVSQKKNNLDFAAIMNNRKIFLAKLSHGVIGEENSYVLGTLLVSKFHQMAMGRQNLGGRDRKSFFLYIDEFHNFICPSMASMLSGARKYQLGLVLAHQEMIQLQNRDSDVAGAVIANPFTRVCFRLGDADARKLSENTSTFEAKDFQNLGTGEAICRIERSDYDFNLKTLQLPVVPSEESEFRRKKIIAASRSRYAIPRQQAAALAELAHEQPTRSRMVHNEPVDSESEHKAADSETAAPASIESAPGKGGVQHKLYQRLIKDWSEGIGFLSTIEKPIEGTNESIDVALESQDVSIACEISITSKVAYELANIRKCLTAGYSHVVVIVEDQVRRDVLQEAASLEFAEQMSHVRLLPLTDAFTFIQGLKPRNIDGGDVRRIKGYGVTVKPVEGAKNAVHVKRLSGVVMAAMQRLTGK